MPSTSKKVLFEDFTFLVNQNVYEPAEDSFLFAENLSGKKSCKVIDVGTGCGILGIIAAKWAEEVFAVDINPYAVRCTKQNANSNDVIDKMVFVRGDLLSCIDRNVKFDLILFNAPYLPSEKADGSWLEYSWAGGKGGREVIDRFIDETPEYLASKGQILLMQSSLSDVDKTIRRYLNKGMSARVVASRSVPFFETIVLISAVRL